MKKLHRWSAMLILFSMVAGLLFVGGGAAQAQAENPPSGQYQWQVEFVDLASRQLSAQSGEVDAMLGGLSVAGVTVEQSAGRATLSGSSDLAGMRSLLFDRVAPLDFLGGVVDLTVTLPESGQLDLVLEARTTTGYRWEVLTGEGATLEASEPEFQMYYPGVGASYLEKISVKGPSGAVVQLVYKRPFGPEETPHAALAVTMPAGVEALDLSDPTPPEVSLPEQLEAQSTAPEAGETIQAQSLPSSFDWRASGVVPSVRDQGSYGSCWSFGTTGVMESAIALAGGPLEDLSEQFLISCNKDGWGNGGLTAHKYHYNTLGLNQTAIGAVLEADKPYVEGKGTCATAYNHPYKLTSWKFITGYEWKMPTVDQIKNAIYTYGPVTARVCSQGFNGYTRGGIYAPTTNNCGGSIDHQIILVGWDDTTQTWILRNSWNTWWGDDGYMRIKWDPTGATSRVGEGASVVSFSYPLPATVTLQGPTSGALVKTHTPNVSWKAADQAASYQLQISTSSLFTSPQEISGITELNRNTGYLDDGKYYWRVRGANSHGNPGAWSAARTFTVDTTPPAPPQLKSPLSPATPLGIPTFLWYPSATATRYQFQYNTSADPGTDDPFSVTYRTGELTTTSHKPLDMPMVQYYWFARAKDAAGNWSAWSAPWMVTVQPLKPAAPVLVSPVSNFFTNNQKPSLTWKSVAYGRLYQVQISPTSTFIAPFETEVSGLTFAPTSNLGEGKYYWRVCGKNELGVCGNWSAVRYFTVDITPPAPPLLKGPMDGAKPIGAPTFTWNPSATANRYEFAYNTTGGTSAFDYRYEVTGTSHKPPAMPMVWYYWFARARDAAGNWSAWSAPWMVQVQPLKPVAPALLSPASGFETNLATPELSWKSVLYGYTYHLRVSTNSTFTDLVQDTEGIDGLSLAVSLPNGQYYWRVRAQNEALVYGPWSAVRSFKVFSGFNSQFNGDATGWSKVSGGDWYVDSSQYYTDGGSTWTYTTARQFGNASNFTFEARMSRSSPYYGAATGIMVRANSTFSSGYAFQYSEDWENFIVLKYSGGRVTALKPWTVSSAINYGWNTLKVVANGSQLDFYINDTLVWTGTDTTFTRGYVGLRMYRIPEVERAYVDWATLSLTPPVMMAQSNMVEQGQVVIPDDPNRPFGFELSPKWNRPK